MTSGAGERRTLPPDPGRRVRRGRRRLLVHEPVRLPHRRREPDRTVRRDPARRVDRRALQDPEPHVHLRRGQDRRRACSSGTASCSSTTSSRVRRTQRGAAGDGDWELLDDGRREAPRSARARSILGGVRDRSRSARGRGCRGHEGRAAGDRRRRSSCTSAAHTCVTRGRFWNASTLRSRRSSLGCAYSLPSTGDIGRYGTRSPTIRVLDVGCGPQAVLAQHLEAWQQRTGAATSVRSPGYTLVSTTSRIDLNEESLAVAGAPCPAAKRFEVRRSSGR